MENIKHKKKKQPKLGTWTISKFIFWWSLILGAVSILYITNNKVNLNYLMFLFLGNLLFFIPNLFYYLNRQISLTQDKIYVYGGLKRAKIYSVDLINELDVISYNNTKIGKLLNFAHVYLLTKSGHVYVIKYLKNYDLFYEKVLEAHENKAKLIDPTYVPEWKKEPSEADTHGMETINNE